MKNFPSSRWKNIFYEFFVILDIHLWIQIRLGFSRKSEKINQIISQRPTTAFDPKREGISVRLD